MKDAKRFCEISTLILSTVLGIFSWQHHSPVYCDVTIEILETLIPFKDLLKTRHFCFKVLFRKFLEIWTISIYQRDALSLVHLTFYMHFEWEMMLGEYICILKSQSASKGVTHLRKPSSIQFTNPQKYICKWMEIYFANPQEDICILKSQSTSKGVTHLRKPSSIQFISTKIYLQIHKKSIGK